VAWQNLAFRDYDGYRPARFASFFSALQRVATSVRRLYLDARRSLDFSVDSTRDFIAALLPALEAIAPCLEYLGMWNLLGYKRA